MIDGLADIVQQGSSARLFLVQAQLGGHGAADNRRFDRMQQYVLRIAVAIFETTKELDEFRVNAMNADIENSFLTRLADRFFDFLFRFAPYTFHSAPVNSAIRNKLVQGQPRDLAPNRVVSRNDHGLRRVVDDQVNSRRGFEGADISPFSTRS